MTRGVLEKLRWLLVSIALAVPVGAATAHESRPAYLEITETAPGRYDVLWRTPVLSGVRLPVTLRMPADARNMTESAIREFQDSLVERRMVEIPGGLAGKRIEFPGLEATGTAVLARVQLGDGAYYTILVHPSQPWIQIAAAEGRLTVFGTYVKHGIEHILLGYDHLLFVLALVLIVSSVRVLVWTITAFTIAHSITLALATLGVVRVPGAPVEATIALSILLLAAEILRVRQGRPSVTARWPWVVAFSFGLLHGFGFAGALTSIGLPKDDVPLALFAFNVGVEVGQLLFIAVVLGLLALAKRVPLPHPVARRALPVASYVIGALAAFWFIERLSGFWT
jgi:hydrogenase/urease accessory protein HupE